MAVDAGKSTMLGVLVKGGLDDGRGKARVNLFRHKHEIESGRTSSVGMEIMGFDSKSEVVVSNVAGRKLTWEEIGRRSVSIVQFPAQCQHLTYTGQSNQLHGFGRPREVSAHHRIRSSVQRAELLPAHGGCEQRAGWYEQVSIVHAFPPFLCTDSDQRAPWHCTGFECSSHGRHYQNRHLPTTNS